VVVHPNETWNDSVASEIENLGTRGHGVVAALPRDWIFPCARIIVKSSKGAAPVPSITRAWVSARTGQSHRTKERTPLSFSKIQNGAEMIDYGGL
jgi:hypothetical protein